MEQSRARMEKAYLHDPYRESPFLANRVTGLIAQYGPKSGELADRRFDYLFRLHRKATILREIDKVRKTGLQQSALGMNHDQYVRALCQIVELGNPKMPRGYCRGKYNERTRIQPRAKYDAELIEQARDALARIPTTRRVSLPGLREAAGQNMIYLGLVEQGGRPEDHPMLALTMTGGEMVVYLAHNGKFFEAVSALYPARQPTLHLPDVAQEPDALVPTCHSSTPKETRLKKMPHLGRIGGMRERAFRDRLKGLEAIAGRMNQGGSQVTVFTPSHHLLTEEF